MPGPHQSRLNLACEPSATRYARQHAKDILLRWGVPRAVTDDALLIVDELVTNAVRHAGSAAEPFDPRRGQPKVRGCALSLWIVNGELLISVYDQNNQRPVLREFSLDAENGRGLQLVAGLSGGAWGYTFLPAEPGKLIWAKLTIPGGTPPYGTSVDAGQPAPDPGAFGHDVPQPRRVRGTSAEARHVGRVGVRLPVPH